MIKETTEEKIKTTRVRVSDISGIGPAYPFKWSFNGDRGSIDLTPDDAVSDAVSLSDVVQFGQFIPSVAHNRPYSDADLREWAKAEGLPTGRGRVPTETREAYEAYLREQVVVE